MSRSMSEAANGSVTSATRRRWKPCWRSKSRLSICAGDSGRGIPSREGERALHVHYGRLNLMQFSMHLAQRAAHPPIFRSLAGQALKFGKGFVKILVQIDAHIGANEPRLK